MKVQRGSCGSFHSYVNFLLLRLDFYGEIEKQLTFSFYILNHLLIGVGSLCKETLKTMTKETVFKCESCTYRSDQKVNLRRHINTVHENLRRFKCTECSRAFNQKNNLQRHVLSVHQDVKGFKCDKCSYESDQKVNLQRHINSIHEKLRPFKCSECSHASNVKQNFHISVNKNFSATI